jgi:hypothetical protein
MPGFSQPGGDGVPEVRPGALAEGGLAPAIMAIVERGVTRRPEQARVLGIDVELRMEESYPPACISARGRGGAAGMSVFAGLR